MWETRLANRRSFLSQFGTGLGGIALTHLLAEEGATDEFGHKAVEDVSTVHDFHATILHLLGLDHKQLTFYHNGLERRLTDVHGHVIHDVVA